MSQEQHSYPDLVALAREMVGRGEHLEDVLEALRERSSSIIDSMKVVRDVMGLPMHEAKSVVHNSRAWSDLRDEHGEFHERAEASVEGQAKRRPDGSFRVEVDLRDKN